MSEQLLSITCVYPYVIVWHRKQQAPHPGARTPFDCCALSFQPFDHPVCVRNSDGTGNVFELVNILPWLKCVSQYSHTFARKPTNLF